MGVGPGRAGDPLRGLLGDGAAARATASISAIVVLVLVAASLGYLQGKGVWREGFTAGWPVVVLAAIAASLPFIVEGHFGILGTSFNPDMSQHLLAADQLAHGHSGQLIRQGYPLGPHSIVVALNKGLDIGLVKGFSGLTRGGRGAGAADRARRLPRPARRCRAPPPRWSSASPTWSPATSPRAPSRRRCWRSSCSASSCCLREAAREPIDSRWRFVPAALIAVGAVYIYSFPGLLWLLGTAVVWAIVEFGLGWLRGRRGASAVRSRRRTLVKPVG